MAGASEGLRLVADVGGTHARFGLAAVGGVPSRQRVFACAEFADPVAAAEAFLREASLRERPREASFAVASPVVADQIEMTNHPWRFSVEETRRRLALHRLVVINDFTALALSLPSLGDADTVPVKPGTPAPKAPLALLGPGTGLGVSALIPHGGSWLALATEGGHRDLAAGSEREWEVVSVLLRRHGHVSAERVLSGPGLAALYGILRELAGLLPETRHAAGVVNLAQGAESPHAVEATRIFSGWLGALAADLALTLGARGGVYIGGGVVPKMGAAFDRGLFIDRFLAKGRFRPYLESIPVHLIVHHTAALLGAARALDEGYDQL